MSTGSGEAVGAHRTGGEHGRSWSEISTTLCVVSGVLGIDSLFEPDFMDGRSIRDVSDTWRAGLMAFRRATRETLKNAQFVDTPRWILIWMPGRKLYCKAL
jgi:hypothetical protein